MSKENISVFSPVIAKSGALIVHHYLAETLHNYNFKPISPKRALFSLVQAPSRSLNEAVVHTQPDMGPHVAYEGQKLVLTFHGFSLDLLSSKYSTLAQRLFYRTLLRWTYEQTIPKADTLTAVSKFTAGLVRKHLNPKQHIEVIPNGVDVSRFAPSNIKQKNEKPVLLFTGNPTYRKGVNALRMLAERFNGKAVVRITAGMRSVTVAGLPDNVEVVPSVNHSDMHLLYQDADIFFFPSLREGMSLSLLEAMACGLPVVASNVSSMPELIDHGKGGMLFPVGDFTGMLNAVEDLIDNRAMRDDMGAYNRDKILNRYTHTMMASAYQEVFGSFG